MFFKGNEEDIGLLRCDCRDTDHMVEIWYDKEDDLVYLTVHLAPRNSFWQRFKLAMKYLFGHKGKYGGITEIVYKPEDFESVLHHVSNMKFLAKPKTQKVNIETLYRSLGIDYQDEVRKMQEEQKAWENCQACKEEATTYRDSFIKHDCGKE